MSLTRRHDTDTGPGVAHRPEWTDHRLEGAGGVIESIPACPACRGNGCGVCLGTGLTKADCDLGGLKPALELRIFNDLCIRCSIG